MNQLVRNITKVGAGQEGGDEREFGNNLFRKRRHWSKPKCRLKGGERRPGEVLLIHRFSCSLFLLDKEHAELVAEVFEKNGTSEEYLTEIRVSRAEPGLGQFKHANSSRCR